jgi:hypothetical protein
MLQGLKSLVTHYLIQIFTAVLHTKIPNVLPVDSLQHGESTAAYTKFD